MNDATLDSWLNHCKNGHEFTPSNMRMSGGWRVCLACARQSRKRSLRPSRTKTRARARQFVGQIKFGPCVDCGLIDPVCMDFDHRPGEVKIANVSTMVDKGRSIASLKAEIAKCDLVCANCHRRRTHRRRQPGGDTGA